MPAAEQGWRPCRFRVGLDKSLLGRGLLPPKRDQRIEPGGASATNWIKVTEDIVAKYPADTTYVWGHSGPRLPVTGTKADVLKMRDYLAALVEYVRAGIKAGKSRDQIVSSKDVLAGFDEPGPLTTRALAGTYDELHPGV